MEVQHVEVIIGEPGFRITAPGGREIQDFNPGDSALTFFQGARQRLLYLRLVDAATGVVRLTYSLGPYIAVHEPMHAVDSKSQLHVLHLAGVQVYRYNVIDASGKVVLSEGFREHNGSRPELITNNVTGDVAVRGGISETETQTPYEQREFPTLSERPPGLPLR